MPRIPYAVNVAWDAAERRPLTALSAALAVVSLAVFAWRPWWPAAAAAFVAGMWLAASVCRAAVLELEKERDAALGEAASYRRRLLHVQAGEAASATTEIRPIGGHGERRS